MSSIPRSALPRPESDCHHSAEPFDAAYRVINQRRDISPAAKLVHAHLVTLARIGRDATQTEIGEAVGMSRHQVWRAIDELVAAGLVQTIRVGLGNPNQYVLLGLPEDEIRGRASGRRPASGQPAGQSHRSRAGTYSGKKNGKKAGYTQPTTSGSLLISRYGPVRRE
jgi:biotin operon repressor